MNEECVTLETAMLMKEKGFDWRCEHTIDCCKIIRRYNLPQDWLSCTVLDGKFIEFLCPTLSVAQKWLRETKNLHICIYNTASGYSYEISKADNGTTIVYCLPIGPNDGGNWDTYEEALEDGILKSLKLIPQ